jgi:hypothetical protein
MQKVLGKLYLELEICRIVIQLSYVREHDLRVLDLIQSRMMRLRSYRSETARCTERIAEMLFKSIEIGVVIVYLFII